jgi:UDP-N-acetylglucosamine diphosphorylase/glucosamine-1-phosphate N-acetyltransferase
MANIILFDSEARNHLLPLTATRPMGELRLGILTLREKWERRLRGNASYITQEYLQSKYPIHIEYENLIINAGILPDAAICQRIEQLRVGQALLFEGDLLAARLNETQFELLIGDEELHELEGTEVSDTLKPRKIERLWDLIHLNGEELVADYQLITSGRVTQALPASNRVIGLDEAIFIEEGAIIEGCTLNTKSGPIYIGAGAEVMEGSLLRGPLCIGAHSIVKMGAKIYGNTTIGPGCRAGGEISRSILSANSNKGHDGYLGDSVLGEWCNLGADTNNSNLKNNYSEVKLWNYETERFEKSGYQFLGLFMGDHAKCGINTMFNTGTVVGVFANVFGAGYPRNFIPDFAWGGTEGGYRSYKFNEACETATAVMARRDIAFTELEKSILYHVYDQTAKFRSWEK